MFYSAFEPTIDEILREPMVRALMRADRVDARCLEAKLRGAPMVVDRAETRLRLPSRFPLGHPLPAAAAIEQGCACR